MNQQAIRQDFYLLRIQNIKKLLGRLYGECAYEISMREDVGEDTKLEIKEIYKS